MFTAVQCMIKHLNARNKTRSSIRIKPKMDGRVQEEPDTMRIRYTNLYFKLSTPAKTVYE